MLIYTKESKEAINFDPKPDDLNIIKIPIDEEIENRNLKKYIFQQNYAFGIAEFNEMAGAFALFEALEIENTFSINASIFFPGHFQFLDFNIIEHIEGGENIISESSIALTKAMKIKGENNEEFLKYLFGKVKYHFVNQNKFANFGAFPEREKIIYIGGILVEGNENIDITTVKNFVCFIENIKPN
uniref:Uncharacterized protein n=1 Tax=Meloidogyne floridensis TaxID=298350 RepID=A0A915NL99_9BILA